MGEGDDIAAKDEERHERRQDRGARGAHVLADAAGDDAERAADDAHQAKGRDEHEDARPREAEADKGVDGQREQQRVERAQEQVGEEERRPIGGDGVVAVLELAPEQRAREWEVEDRLEEDVERRVVHHEEDGADRREDGRERRRAAVVEPHHADERAHHQLESELAEELGRIVDGVVEPPPHQHPDLVECARARRAARGPSRRA